MTVSALIFYTVMNEAAVNIYIQLFVLMHAFNSLE